MTTAFRLRPGAVERLARIDSVLESAYGTPEAELGNKADPLDEAIYIILSFQTDLVRFSSTWSRLRTKYPTWATIERARARDVARVLRVGGLHRQKTRTIFRLLAAVRKITGELSLDFLRTLDDEDAERVLTRLPGLSWKAARCVLLYSLGRNVLPVDSNTFRILKRTGVLAARSVYRRRTLHDAVQAAVPAHRRRALHVNLVVHGQRTCTPRRPLCACCPLVADCPRNGLRDRSRARAALPVTTAVKAQAVISRGDART
jgi:endonuclease III